MVIKMIKLPLKSHGVIMGGSRKSVKGGRYPGGTPICSYIRRLWPFILVRNFEFQYFFFLGGGGGVQKRMNMFLSMKILWIIIGGHHIIGLY